MSTDERHADSSFDSNDNSSTDAISRRELEIRFHIQKLANLRLRRRISRLETIHDLGMLDWSDDAQSRRNDLREELDAIRGRSGD
jgi:hypothetical protein